MSLEFVAQLLHPVQPVPLRTSAELLSTTKVLVGWKRRETSSLFLLLIPKGTFHVTNDLNVDS